MSTSTKLWGKQLLAKLTNISHSEHVDESSEMVVYSLSYPRSATPTLLFELTESSTSQECFFVIISDNRDHILRLNYFGSIDNFLSFVSDESFANSFRDAIAKKVLTYNFENGDKALFRTSEEGGISYLGRSDVIRLLKQHSIEAFVTGHELEGGISIHPKDLDVRIDISSSEMPELSMVKDDKEELFYFSCSSIGEGLEKLEYLLQTIKSLMTTK